VTQDAGVLFVVNDHVDLALLSQADGVHLGADDLSISAARRIAGDSLLIGASASTPASALAAIKSGADYIGCGPAFATPLKPQKVVIGPSGVAEIGGIDASNIPQLKAAGVRRACVVRSVGEASDPEAAARELRAMLEA